MRIKIGMRDQKASRMPHLHYMYARKRFQTFIKYLYNLYKHLETLSIGSSENIIFLMR